MRELICGKNSVLDAIDNELPIEVVYTNRPNEIKGNVKKQVVDRKFLDKLTRENHQGFVAMIKEYNYYDFSIIEKDKPEKVLILDHLQDPRNLGSILRTANAFNVNHIIIPKNRAAKITASAIKVSSGGYVGMKIIRVPSLLTIVEKLKKNKYWIYATAIEKGVDIDKVNFNNPMALIVGNEEKGVSKTLLKHSDQNVFIKTSGTVQSLNVSVATAIALSKI